MFLSREVFYVRHGDSEPRAILEFPEAGPILPYGFCRLFGRVRTGLESLRLWPLQRLGVSPDGALVVFEVTDDFSLFSRDQVPPEQEGIYVVRADGTGLHKLGPASSSPCWQENVVAPFFTFSPDGRTATFTDLDPELPRLDAPQIFTLDVASGKRTQLTALPAANPPAGQLYTWNAYFLDAETIVFTSYANPTAENHPQGANPVGVATLFTVKTDDTGHGTGLEPIPVVAVPGGGFIPNFSITSAEPTASRIPLSDCRPTNGAGVLGDVCIENFVFDTDPDQVLQLTNYQRSDTTYGRLTADRQRSSLPRIRSGRI